MIKVTIKADKCIGCGTCVSLCPEKFEMNGNKAIAKNEAECSCDIEDIMENCPADAIVRIE